RRRRVDHPPGRRRLRLGSPVRVLRHRQRTRVVPWGMHRPSEAAGARGGMADHRRHGRLLPTVETVRDDPGLDRPHPVYRLGGHRHRRRILPPDPRPTHRRRTAPEHHMSYLRFATKHRPAVTPDETDPEPGPCVNEVILGPVPIYSFTVQKAWATGGPNGNMIPVHYVDASGAESAELFWRSEEHTSELQSREKLVCRLLLEKK